MIEDCKADNGDLTTDGCAIIRDTAANAICMELGVGPVVQAASPRWQASHALALRTIYKEKNKMRSRIYMGTTYLDFLPQTPFSTLDRQQKSNDSRATPEARLDTTGKEPATIPPKVRDLIEEQGEDIGHRCEYHKKEDIPTRARHRRSKEGWHDAYACATAQPQSPDGKSNAESTGDVSRTERERRSIIHTMRAGRRGINTTGWEDGPGLS